MRSLQTAGLSVLVLIGAIATARAIEEFEHAKFFEGSYSVVAHTPPENGQSEGVLATGQDFTGIVGRVHQSGSITTTGGDGFHYHMEWNDSTKVYDLWTSGPYTEANRFGTMDVTAITNGKILWLFEIRKKDGTLVTTGSASERSRSGG